MERGAGRDPHHWAFETGFKVSTDQWRVAFRHSGEPPVKPCHALSGPVALPKSILAAIPPYVRNNTPNFAPQSFIASINRSWIAHSSRSPGDSQCYKLSFSIDPLFETAAANERTCRTPKVKGGDLFGWWMCRLFVRIGSPCSSVTRSIQIT